MCQKLRPCRVCGARLHHYVCEAATVCTQAATVCTQAATVCTQASLSKYIHEKKQEFAGKELTVARERQARSILPPWAGPELRACASSRRAGRLWERRAALGAPLLG